MVVVESDYSVSSLSEVEKKRERELDNYSYYRHRWKENNNMFIFMENRYSVLKVLYSKRVY